MPNRLLDTLCATCPPCARRDDFGWSCAACNVKQGCTKTGTYSYIKPNDQGKGIAEYRCVRPPVGRESLTPSAAAEMVRGVASLSTPAKCCAPAWTLLSSAPFSSLFPGPGTQL